MLRFYVGILTLGTVVMAADVSTPAVTFNKDVLPVLQKNCQSVPSAGGDWSDGAPDL